MWRKNLGNKDVRVVSRAKTIKYYHLSHGCVCYCVAVIVVNVGVTNINNQRMTSAMLLFACRKSFGENGTCVEVDSGKL